MYKGLFLILGIYLKRLEKLNKAFIMLAYNKHYIQRRLINLVI